MAASRVISARRLCQRYQIFFYIAALLVLMQLFMAWNFYSITSEENQKVNDWQRRREDLPKVVQSAGDKVPAQVENAISRQIREEKKNEEDKVKSPINSDTNDVDNSHRHLNNGGKDNVVADNGDQNGNGNGAADGPNIIQAPGLANQQAPGLVQGASPGNKTIHAPVPAKLPPVKNYANNQVGDLEWQPKCHIKSKDALSALMRAQTVECKKTLAELACLDQQGNLYPKSLPRYCPLKGQDASEYVGCFEDEMTERTLADHHTDFRENNSPDVCINHCLRAGYKYAGMQFSYECWCGENLTRRRTLEESNCDSSCAGDPRAKCGGYLTINIYKTGIGGKTYSSAPLVHFADLLPSETPVRLVFVLTVNGRALRQVKRLFRALYHSDHYYYIHVDSRQDYLRRELFHLTKEFDNVRMAPWSMSTIWGGASLLTMLMRCMKDLLDMDDWKWDFFINLSESDYPVKSLDDLVAYLTRYKDKNLVRSHGRDTPRFIKKQGLDKTFVECDTHMWRLGPRRLPDGIRIDGGSDWICLNRKFANYVTTTNDQLVEGLMKYWKYTLLPAESFFHTVLQNSKFCNTMVNNNLHLTNWRRKQGCKCQYKHIVDWCGCSPNDFMPSDMEKILQTEDRTIYFARKFEAIVNQEVINELDVYLYGAYPEDTIGLNSFWQSEFHLLDSSRPGDEFLTFYHTFTRLGTQVVRTSHGDPGCTFTPSKLLEVSVYSYSDNIQGLLVYYEARSEKDLKTYTLETFVQPKKTYSVLKPLGSMTRLKVLEVGTNFDPKEEIFRNYGGLLGPYSDISLAHAWGAGSKFTATFVWVDPAQVIAASYEIAISEEENVGNHKPIFAKPLRPGIWTVKVLYMWEVAAEVQFLITPFSHYGQRPVTAGEARLLHRGPGDTYTGQDFDEMKEVLQLEGSELSAKTALKNADKSGNELLAWIDDLTSQTWHVTETCIGGSTSAVCPALDLCVTTLWSSRSPDPKSEIPPIDKETGRIR